MWLFEQAQGIGLGLNVFVNVRMVVVRLASGGLWVYNPVAPTAECLSLLRELGAPVEAIVLGTTLYEHKIFLPPFARRFPNAAVFAVSPQWAFPLDLPPVFLGFPLRTSWLRPGTEEQWPRELGLELCVGGQLGANYRFVEAAFFHYESRTLIVTDALAYVERIPPEVLFDIGLESLGGCPDESVVLQTLRAINYTQVNERMLPGAGARPTANPGSRLALGWRRNAVFALYIVPDGPSVLDPDVSGAFVRIAGRWLVPPIVMALVFAAEEVRSCVLSWIDRICQRWPDVRAAVPAHFGGPIACRVDDLQGAFQVLRGKHAPRLVEDGQYGPDLDRLVAAARALRSAGIGVGPGGVRNRSSA